MLVGGMPACQSRGHRPRRRLWEKQQNLPTFSTERGTSPNPQGADESPVAAGKHTERSSPGGPRMHTRVHTVTHVCAHPCPCTRMHTLLPSPAASVTISMSPSVSPGDMPWGQGCVFGRSCAPVRPHPAPGRPRARPGAAAPRQTARARAPGPQTLGVEEGPVLPTGSVSSPRAATFANVCVNQYTN